MQLRGAEANFGMIGVMCPRRLCRLHREYIIALNQPHFDTRQMGQRIMRVQSQKRIAKWSNLGNALRIAHQRNGKGKVLNRSWRR